jgi:hypothetical protein
MLKTFGFLAASMPLLSSICTLQMAPRIVDQLPIKMQPPTSSNQGRYKMVGGEEEEGLYQFATSMVSYLDSRSWKLPWLGDRNSDRCLGIVEGRSKFWPSVRAAAVGGMHGESSYQLHSQMNPCSIGLKAD